MRCPKCHYLSFEPESRCRNCGYDFELAGTASEGDLAIKPADAAEAPLADFDLRERMVESPGPAPAPAAPRPVAVRAPTTTTELPLFVRGLPPPELPAGNATFNPPISLASHPPRPPLAVRRRAAEPAPSPFAAPAATAAGTRTTGAFSALASARSGGAEHGKLLDVPQGDPVWAPLPAADQKRLAAKEQPASSQESVGARQRVIAALVDASLLGAIDFGIVWFTLKICALTIGQAATLPLLPLATFCVILDVGYLLMFTATSGQTVGKMAAGIRVVGVSPDSADAGHVTIRQAALRALLTLPSLLAVGAGFIPALFGRGPAVHDRIAHTRVVRA